MKKAIVKIPESKALIPIIMQPAHKIEEKDKSTTSKVVSLKEKSFFTL